jgi:hypothetical protein
MSAVEAIMWFINLIKKTICRNKEHQKE